MRIGHWLTSTLLMLTFIGIASGKGDAAAKETDMDAAAAAERVSPKRRQSQVKSLEVNNHLTDTAENRLNQARLAITFRQPLKSLAGSGPQQIRVSAPVIDPLNVNPSASKPFENAPVGTRGCKILKAEISASNPYQLIVTVEGKLPKGTQLEILSNVVTFRNGQSLPRTQQVATQGLSVAAASADNGPFKATNLNVVTRAAYPQAPPNDRPVTTPPFVPKSRVLDSLKFVSGRGLFHFPVVGDLLKELGEPVSIIDRLVQDRDVAGLVNRAWDNPKLRFSFADENLRAGAISYLDVEAMGGVLRAYTLGQNETGQPLKVEFDTPANPIGTVATSFISSHKKVVINDLFAGEDPRALFCVAAHEAGHQDLNGNSHWEERIARTIETVCWEIGTNRDPRIFSKPSELTPLVREFSDRGIAFGHSGKRGSPGYFEADQIGSGPAMVFRGGDEGLKSFGEYLDKTIGGAPLPMAVTPTNKAVDEFLRAWGDLQTAAYPVGFPKTFGPAWLDWFERTNKTLGSEDRMIAFSKYALTGGS